MNSRVRDQYRFLFPLGLTLALWVGSSLYMTPQLPTPPVGGIDKLAHFLVYGLMATAWMRVWRFRKEGNRMLAGIAIAAVAGITEECIQYMNPYRSFEWADWVADVTGALLAVVLYRYWGWYRSVLEWKIDLLKR